MSPIASQEPVSRKRPLPFTEEPAWRAVGEGWRHLHGGFRTRGMSFEWHDFECSAEFDWARSFHPESVEICLNLTGEGWVRAASSHAHFIPMTSGFYRRGRAPMRGARAVGQRHQFLTVEMSFPFLRRHLSDSPAALHPLVRGVIRGRPATSAVAPPRKLTGRQQQILLSLRDPPVPVPARGIWFQTKALELAAEMFFKVAANEDRPQGRRHRLAAERVEKVIALLRRKLAGPPSLDEIGREVGCSPFHLSRTFSEVLGMTIPQYLRQIRMERAAELLRSGTHNVSETSLEVGYQSLSHFSQTFHETFGCCPGLYPLRTATQVPIRLARKASEAVG